MAPARVVAVDGVACQVELGGRVDTASMMLEPDLAVGDWVLVNAGTVVRRLDEEQAAEMTRAFGIIYGLDEESEPPVMAQAGAAGSEPAGPAAGSAASRPAAGSEASGPAGVVAPAEAEGAGD